MIIEDRAFICIQEAENTICKNLITYGVYCATLLAHVSAYYFFYA